MGACYEKLMVVHFSVIVVILVALSWENGVICEPQVPCYFIFGDSLVDNGNNNDLLSVAKANFLPYGIDFPGGPTGRFSNGKTTVDILAELLGFDSYVPPFATARGIEILRGVNYGSGGAGILDETGRNMGGRISLNLQLLNHKFTTFKIAALLGRKYLAKEYLKRCLYTIGMGNNDYINNYLMPQYYPSSRMYTPDQYAKLLVQQYSKQIRSLYEMGARKVALFGLGRIGCVPEEISTFGTNGTDCVGFINDYVEIFNVKLQLLVDNLNMDLIDAKFIYINPAAISREDLSTLGVTVVHVPCCEACVAGSVPCNNRKSYAFWDGVHPTEIMNTHTAGGAYTAMETLLDKNPIDTNRLAQI